MIRVHQVMLRKCGDVHCIKCVDTLRCIATAKFSCKKTVYSIPPSIDRIVCICTSQYIVNRVTKKYGKNKKKS